MLVLVLADLIQLFHQIQQFLYLLLVHYYTLLLYDRQELLGHY